MNKKSVFELTRKEGKAIDKEMRKTSYYKQFLIGFILCDLLLIIALFGVCGASEDIQLLGILIVLCFAVLTSLIVWIVRFFLVKKYYDEVKKGE